jgi:hypothetical protein
MEPLDNQGQHDNHDKEIPRQKTRFIDRIKTFFKRNPTRTILTVVVIFLFLSAIAVTMNGVQRRQEARIIAQNNVYPTGSQHCGGSGVGPSCSPTITPERQGRVCAQDMKRCPDGSLVKRIPPNCEFAACPGTNQPPVGQLSQPPNASQPTNSSNTLVVSVTSQPSQPAQPTAQPPQPQQTPPQQPTNTNDIWTRIVQALQDLIAALGRLLNIFPDTPPAQPTPIAQPTRQSPQPLPSATPANPQVSRPAPTADSITRARTACEQNRGKWLPEFNECDGGLGNNGLNQAACTALGGTYNSCASRCRHSTLTQGSCTAECIKVCKFQ